MRNNLNASIYQPNREIQTKLRSNSHIIFKYNGEEQYGIVEDKILRMQYFWGEDTLDFYIKQFIDILTESRYELNVPVFLTKFSVSAKRNNCIVIVPVTLDDIRDLTEEDNKHLKRQYFFKPRKTYTALPAIGKSITHEFSSWSGNITLEKKACFFSDNKMNCIML